MSERRDRFGVDVSQYQGEINWTALATRAHFAYIRLRDGTLLDSCGARNWQASRGLLPRGAYQAWYPTINWEQQARAIVESLAEDRGELPPALDIESPRQGWSAAWRASLLSALQLVEELDGRTPVLYTGAWYVNSYLGLIPELARYPLWCANYTDAPIIPKPWITHAIWQFSSTGAGADYGVPLGANKYIDLDQCPEQALAALLGKEQTTMSKVRITSANQSYDLDTPITISDVPATPATDVWRTEFYNGMALAGAVIATKDYPGPDLSMQLGTASPVPGVVPVDKWSARFTRKSTYAAGHYKATIGADDGVRFYVDGVLKIDAWKDQVATLTAEFDLTAGEHTFVTEYYENGGAANLSVVIVPF